MDAPLNPSEAVCRRAIWQLVQTLASQGTTTASILATIEDLHLMIMALDRRLTRLEGSHDDA